VITRRLIVETADGSRELLFIGRLTVGRGVECDISLNDGKVSRVHAAFDATGTVPQVTDLGSRNGMLVNNRKVTTADVADGDVVVIGDARIRVVMDVADGADTARTTMAATDGDDRTAVLAMPVAAAAPPPIAPPAAVVEGEERTAVLPRLAARTRRVATRSRSSTCQRSVRSPASIWCSTRSARPGSSRARSERWMSSVIAVLLSRSRL
jgi:pSer/pThr/pTyr-binding forkhead associated (FHA) protein